MLNWPLTRKIILFFLMRILNPRIGLELLFTLFDYSKKLD